MQYFGLLTLGSESNNCNDNIILDGNNKPKNAMQTVFLNVKYNNLETIFIIEENSLMLNLSARKKLMK